MQDSIFNIPLRDERDVVQERRRARELAALLGFDNQDQIRLATATSEIARNAFRYARDGKVAFIVQLNDRPRLDVIVNDSGAGIENLSEILDGRYRSETGLGKGIVGTKRLMDDFDISTGAEGTRVRLSKFLPQHSMITPRSVRELGTVMRQKQSESPYEEIDRQ